MVYRQSGSLVILHIAIAGREVTTRISRDLKHVRKMGYRFTGIVSDGGTGIVGAVDRVFPHIPHQICLAHLHRGIIATIGRYPREERVRELKALADHVWLIESKDALRWWEDKLTHWVNANNSYLKERRYDIDYNWWYIHKGVRKAVATLQELPRTSFKFLDYPLMPKTTNEIEAQFGHLGKRWLSHRGMKRERWKDFLKWFVYFYNQEKLVLEEIQKGRKKQH
jgi:transposase-like protein